ncbi:[protein-PII] uridylyltransferase [bacterium]|nr:[protein-PII] uridylyltransferase [bacterium]
MLLEPQNQSEIELHPGDFDRYIPDLNLNGVDVKEASLAYLEECRANVKKLQDAYYHSLHVTGALSRMTDKLIIGLFKVIEKEVLRKTTHQGDYATLVATGGYGRGEMNVYSDIDLLFLYPKNKGAYIEMLTEKLLYILWDLKLDVGYATRTIGDCKKLFLEDVTIMTSMLDRRYLAGDNERYEDFNQEILNLVKSGSVRKKMVESKVRERKDRVSKNGASVFVLEPNVKECAGGLRDLQTCQWLSKLLGLDGSFASLSEREYLTIDQTNVLGEARSFLLRIRNELHFLTKRKTDQLTFDRQENVARHMGFENDDDIPLVERFMQAYYKYAYQVSAITDTLIRRIEHRDNMVTSLVRRVTSRKIDDDFRIVDAHIAAKNTAVFDENPKALMTLFYHVQTLGMSIHPETKEVVRLKSAKLDNAFRTNPDNIEAFRKLLNSYKNLGLTFFEMHDVQFLDEWMPEFKKLRCRVQHDIYHIYTIDTHSIFAVNELSKLVAGDYAGKFDFFLEILKEVQQPELLTLGLFLHDIGKGEGGNHSVKGAEIAKKITDRINYSDEEKKAIDFLITSHLLMPHLSQRRDIEDPDLIINFARSMGTLDNLNMLFLLTWGDIRAVGPEAWTDWKGTLLEKLYRKTREVLLKGDFSPESSRLHVSQGKERLREALLVHYPVLKVDYFLDQMPPRYFVIHTPDEAIKHFLLFNDELKDEVTVKQIPIKEEGVNEILIDSLNSPKVFYLVTGVMLAYSINILRADIFPTRDGHLLIILKITDEKGGMIHNDTLFKEVKLSLGEVISGRVKVESLLEKRNIPDYLKKKQVQKAKTKVVVDNDVSAYSTVIDIYAHDRLGLLYDISRTLYDQGCYVEVSKISTKVEQATDVFYVKDIFGHKITSKAKITGIQKALMAVIEPEIPAS